ncbi:hypothetical protein C1X24_27295, partial [Pseudomonas sp. FW305-124]
IVYVRIALMKSMLMLWINLAAKRTGRLTASLELFVKPILLRGKYWSRFKPVISCSLKLVRDCLEM